MPRSIAKYRVCEIHFLKNIVKLKIFNIKKMETELQSPYQPRYKILPIHDVSKNHLGKQGTGRGQGGN